MIKKIKILTLALIVTAMSTACNCCTVETIEAGSNWKVESMTFDGKQVVIPAEAATIAFDSTMVYGFSGCNRYFGGYKLGESGAIEFAHMGSTRMACPDLTFEDQYLANLSKITLYKVDGEILTFKNAEDKALISFKKVINTETKADKK